MGDRALGAVPVEILLTWHRDPLFFHGLKPAGTIGSHVIELDLKLTAGQALAECRRRGLVITSRRELARRTGSTHWHLSIPGRAGTLELNEWRGRVWVKSIHSARGPGQPTSRANLRSSRLRQSKRVPHELPRPSDSQELHSCHAGAHSKPGRAPCRDQTGPRTLRALLPNADGLDAVIARGLVAGAPTARS